jgi:hypothetical protein
MAAAKAELAGLLQQKFQIQARAIQLNDDQYSLNSLNGFFETDDGAFFFKFHQEEGEDQMRGEYYRADLLVRENLPVDMPVMASTEPGEQILIYRRRHDRRFSDVLFELDARRDQKPEACKLTNAVAAERSLNEKILKVARTTLHPVIQDDVRNEAIHRLFHERMVDLPAGTYPGGRYRSFYIGQDFELPGVRLPWEVFSTAKLVLNGQVMDRSIAEIFDQAATNLHPTNLANAGGMVAHGDAHNANVWFEETYEPPKLCYFDPAFAGEHVPALLAEVKATFHNIFAHPLWLYDPDLARQSYSAQANYSDGTLSIDTDWRPSQVRLALLEAKTEAFWQPFLAHLKQEGLLPETWRPVLRSALAMCPALVTNLRANAGRHNPTSSAIGFYVIAMMGSEPLSGETVVTRFLDSIDPHLC